MALLHVFYREKSGIQYRRDTRYDWQDFVCKLRFIHFPRERKKKNQQLLWAVEVNVQFELCWMNTVFAISAAVGGLLGLGVGFSLMSVMEILYFFSGLRNCLRRHRPLPEPIRPIDPVLGRRLPLPRRLHLYY